MDNKQAYNKWAESYDAIENKTRDLEAIALREVLGNSKYRNILEIGCGTGKNTEWLMTKAEQMTALDFSSKMLSRAKEKIKSGKVKFIKSDIKKDWVITRPKYNLVTCSLILEHIKDIEFIFRQAYEVLKINGLLYIGELHPQKQYLGSKARFKKGKKTVTLDCYTHNISDFIYNARKCKFKFIESKDWYDKDNSEVPRLITMVFQKKFIMKKRGIL